MGYATEGSTVLAHPVELLSVPGSTGIAHDVSDVGELLWRILNLQPHEELSVAVDPGGIVASGQSGIASHRGYLMDVELGTVCTVCIKRTF